MVNNIDILKKEYFNKFPNGNLELLELSKNKYNYVLVNTIYGKCLIRKEHLMEDRFPRVTSAINPIEFIKNKFYSKFPNSNLKILCLVENKYSKIRVQNEFGICEVFLYSLLKGDLPSINTSLDKLSYYKNQFYTKHPNSKHIILKLSDKNVFIETNFGICKINSKSFLNNPKGSILSAIDKSSFWTNQAKKIHGELYDYSLIKYINAKIDVKIVCKIHGEFEQNPGNHLTGKGCVKCQYETISIKNAYDNSSYSLKSWEKSANKSKNFDSFKVYVIRCWNENEEFYKIGRTFTTVHKRYKTKNLMPYNWEFIKEYTGTAKEMFNLELKMKKENKVNKHLPKISFKGKHECFKKIKY